jgi:Mn-dependent DtxR family transcriptional regulator
MGEWTLFSNYGHVLVCLAGNPRVRLREVAAQVGITERAVQKIVRDLQEAGYVSVSKQGRCNRYRINRRKSLRHPLESHCNVGRLLSLITAAAAAEPAGAEHAATDPRPPATKEAARSPEPAAEPTPAAEAKKPEPPAQEPVAEERPGPIDTRQQGSLF